MEIPLPLRDSWRCRVQPAAYQRINRLRAGLREGCARRIHRGAARFDESTGAHPDAAARHRSPTVKSQVDQGAVGIPCAAAERIFTREPVLRRRADGQLMDTGEVE